LERIENLLNGTSDLY